jgi:uncharacterized protein YdaU (DUF1376 family)
MTDAKLPYMPLYVHDIESSRYCRKMTDADFGRYMRILIRQWVEGHVDADPVEVVKDAMLDHGSDESVAAMLNARFPLTKGGFRANPRCAVIRDETLAKVEVNRTNGRRGGRPPNNPTVNRSDNPTETHRFQSGLPNQNPTAKQSESELDSESDKEEGASAPSFPPTANASADKKQQSATAGAITWTAADGFSNITDYDRASWRKAYPACNIDRQLAAAHEWLLSNPQKAVKRAWRRFVTNWLQRSQERGGDERGASTGGNPPPRRAMTIEEAKAKGIPYE